jgi:RES domain-containing protein
VRAYSFARDPGIVAAEHARHLAAELPTGGTERIAREMFQLHVSLDRVLDLTDPRVIEAMGAEALERWILDLRRTQAASSYLLTHVPGLQGLILPSVAFLDDLTRSNVVVFRDAIEPAAAFGPPRHVMDIILAGTGSEGPDER